ncbi:MAG TPA: beta-L-arabinofuranosidase domain-containing protein [Verrucomicrobiae bacterium]
MKRRVYWSAQVVLLVSPLLAFPARGDSLQIADSAFKVRPKIELQAQAFDLRDVRLLEGPFKHAQDLDERYLLSLDVDRLLHTFRLNAGLPSAVQPLGGWEEPKSEVRGHFVGHYLTACALMYAATGNDRLKEKGAAVVAGLAQCQAKFATGYLSAFPESFFDRVEARQQVWAPYYTLHKIYAGLMDMYLYCGNLQALEVCRKFGNWVVQRNARLTDTQMQAMLGNEHGGMNECLAELYALTGEEKYLKTSLRFNHQAVVGPASRQVDNLTGLHANTQIPKFVGTARQYELTADPLLKTASLFFWTTVVKERSYVIGGHSDGEHFSPKEKLSTAFGPSTTETCNTYNMLKLTRHLFCWDPQPAYADYYERALCNHILASQDPGTGMMCYYVPLRPGSHKEYNAPLDSFWCCTGTGVENHAKYADSIYFHSGTGTLYVSLFIASELNWRAQGVHLRQETSFPVNGATKLTVACDKAGKFELCLRRPSWAVAGYEVRINGRLLRTLPSAGSWVALNRTWKNGDTVEVRMPFVLRTEGFADNPSRFAFLSGPLVLGAEVDPTRAFPAVVASRDEAVKTLISAAKPNTFIAPAAVFKTPGGRSRDLTLEPFFGIHNRRPYMVYFDSFTPGQWKEKEMLYAAEMARERELVARTVDFVTPDGEQSERDHAMKGDNTAHGDFGDRKWRHATEGGWFSWQLKVLADTPQELAVTYWGSDGGNRFFDVFIDGRRIATERLQNNRPNKFYEEIYPLTPDLVKNKARIELKFQAKEGAWAGGVFGARVLRKTG